MCTGSALTKVCSVTREPPWSCSPLPPTIPLAAWASHSSLGTASIPQGLALAVQQGTPHPCHGQRLALAVTSSPRVL